MNIQNLLLPLDLRENKKAYYLTLAEVQKNFEQLSFNEIEQIVDIKDFVKLARDHDDFLFNEYLSHGRVCPYPISLHGDVPEVYMDLILENAQLTDHYLEFDLKNNKAFHQKVLDYCVQHQRAQNSTIYASPIELYLNLLDEDKVCDYVCRICGIGDTLDFSKINSATTAKISTLYPNIWSTMDESEQLKYVQHVNIFGLHSIENLQPIIKNKLFEAAPAQLVKKSVSIMHIEPELLAYLVDAVPELVREKLLVQTEHIQFGDEGALGTYQINMLQEAIIQNYHYEALKILTEKYSDVAMMSIEQCAKNYSFPMAFDNFLMLCEEYNSFDHLPTAQSRARAIAALECVSQSWAIQTLVDTPQDMLLELLPLYPQCREQIEPILTKIQLGEQVQSKSVGRTLKI